MSPAPVITVVLVYFVLLYVIGWMVAYRARDRRHKVEMDAASGWSDHQTIIERSSDDARFVIVWNAGRGFYLANGDPSPSGPSLAHWTSNVKAATKFHEDEAQEWILSGRLLDENGQEYALSEIGPLVLEVVSDGKGHERIFRPEEI